MTAPDNIATYKIRAHATAGKLSDAEERPLPILPSRERLIQSRVVALKGNDKKLIEFAELLKNADPSLRSESMTVSIDPQLALSVLRSIPFLALPLSVGTYVAILWALGGLDREILDLLRDAFRRKDRSRAQEAR